MRTLAYIVTFIVLGAVTCLSIHSSRDSYEYRGGTLTKKDTLTSASAHSALLSAGTLGPSQEQGVQRSTSDFLKGCAIH